MPLQQVASIHFSKPDKLYSSPIMTKPLKQLGERVFNSMIRRLKLFEQSRKEECSGAYTIFAAGLGDQGVIPQNDYNYLWENASKVYGDGDMAKRFLGTMLMYVFAISDRHWLFIQDPDKRKKLAQGDIPQATQYFLAKKDRELPPDEKFQNSIAELKKKYGNKR